MANRKLSIAPNLKLDPDYVGGGTFGLLAKKGAGKSYLARVMAEEFWKASIPFVLLDPMGTSWGLRSSADGKGNGIPVAIFGGSRGDAPLERGGGALMADLVVDERLSMVLDISGLGSRSAERQFAQDFFERLYRRNSELVHLLVDEADLFAPQKPQAGDRQLLGVTENIVRRGRNRGIGITLITQRPAVLNKDVLTQVDGLVSMRITGLTDRQAIDAWVAGHGDDPDLAKEVKGSLAGLANGECWWWVPELGILKQVQVRASETFDSSPTRKRGEKGRGPKSFADVDMGAIEQRMEATIERAKSEDPKELRKRITELERELSKAPKEAPAPEPTEVPVLADGQTEALQTAIDSAQDLSERITAAVEPVATELRRIETRPTSPPSRSQSAAKRRGSPAPARREAGGRRREAPPASRRPTQPPAHSNGHANEGDVQLKAGARRMLTSLAQLHPTPLTRTQLGTLADITPGSGTFSDYINSLKRAGLVVEDNKLVSLTADGESEVAGELGSGAPSVAELQTMWSRKFKAGARRMLDELVEVYPDGLTREELGERTGITKGSGTFSDYLNSLKRNTVAEERNGEVFAGEALFIGS